MLSPIRLQKHLKGVANHRRIDILLLLDASPGLSLLNIAQHLKFNFKTAADHIQRLVTAGLVSKGRNSGSVPHRLTKRGQIVLGFLKTLE